MVFSPQNNPLSFSLTSVCRHGNNTFFCLPRPYRKTNLELDTKNHSKSCSFSFFTFCVEVIPNYPFKVACMVNLKLGFMAWFLYYFIIPIKQCKIPYKLYKSSIVFEKPGILSKKLKTFRSSNYPRVKYFLLKFCICFLPMSTKGVWDFLYFV